MNERDKHVLAFEIIMLFIYVIILIFMLTHSDI